MRAAITGHLVLSTIHTFDALGTIDRLLDIGVEPYLISSGVRGIVSQRLVRKVCPFCRKEYVPEPEEFYDLGLEYDPEVRFYTGQGCPQCFNTGYRGRTGVFEILLLSRGVRALIVAGASREEIQDAIQHSQDFQTMAQSVADLVLRGVTTVQEARRTLVSME